MRDDPVALGLDPEFHRRRGASDAHAVPEPRLGQGHVARLGCRHPRTPGLGAERLPSSLPRLIGEPFEPHECRQGMVGRAEFPETVLRLLECRPSRLLGILCGSFTICLRSGVGQLRLRLRHVRESILGGAVERRWERLDGLRPGIAQLAADGGLERGEFTAVLPPGFRCVGVNQRRPATRQHAEEGVEIGLRDRVELVIVAAGARHRQPKKRLRDHVDLVVGERHHLVERVGGRKPVRHHAEVADAERRLVDVRDRIDSRVGQQVAGDLFADETVDGYVVADRTDAPVTVPPGMRDRRISLTAVRLAVADAVEPMPGPVLGEVGRSEQPVDELFPPVGSGIGMKRQPFLRRRWQAGQRERGPPQERVGIGLSRGLDAGSGQLRRDESIHGMVARGQPAGVARSAGRHRGPLDRLEAPPLFAAGKDRVPGCFTGELLGGRRLAARVGGTQCDPSLKGPHDLGRRLGAALGHEQVLLVPERNHDHALGRLPRHHGRP